MFQRGRGRGSFHPDHPTLPPPPAPPMTFEPAQDIEPEMSGQQVYSGQGYDGEDVNGVNLPDADVKMDGEGQEHDMTEEGGNKGAYKPPWRRPRVAGTRLKRKKVPGLKNTRIKKYAQPKNAVMCLNELDPGVAYVTDQEGGMSQPFCISVEIHGQKYRGFGSSKQLAKQAAAEAALISFVKPPVTTTEDKQDDKTPWATLVSFAMYKLFNDWREGRVGTCPPPTQPYGTAVPTGSMLAGINAFFSQPAEASAATEDTKPQAAAIVETINAHLGGRVPGDTSADAKAKGKALPKPAKQVPEGAPTMHPVMVLNQMKPGVKYNVNESVRDGKSFFILKADIDDQEFTGEGPNVKKAKFALAKSAIHQLFGVESTFVAS